MSYLSFCPTCGKEVGEEAFFCERCGEKLPDMTYRRGVEWVPPRKGVRNHLKHAFKVVQDKPIILFPELLAGVFTFLLYKLTGWVGEHPTIRDFLSSFIGQETRVSFVAYEIPEIPQGFWYFLLGLFLFLLVGEFISKLFTFISTDMSRNAYLDRPVSLRRSMSYVRSRLGTFIAATIVSSLLATTIVLLPVGLILFIVIIVDETGIRDSITKTFKMVVDNMGTSTILIILYIVSFFLLDLVPYVAKIIRPLPGVLIYLAFIDLYHQYKKIKRI